MRMSDLQSSGAMAQQYGVKAIVYGPPGSAKTPSVATAPAPVLLAAEPGMLSMKGTNIATYEAQTWAKIKEFFEWVHGSNESRQFQTVAVDSVSQICEIHLRDNPKKHSHGLQKYGAMAEDVYDILHKLYYMKERHIYLICKQAVERTDASTKVRPYFPGNDLDIKVPHLFDEILHLDNHIVPGVGPTRAFHCFNGIGAMCRDRSGKLQEYEPPNVSALFAKCMA